MRGWRFLRLTLVELRASGGFEHHAFGMLIGDVEVFGEVVEVVEAGGDVENDELPVSLWNEVAETLLHRIEYGHV